MESLNKLLEYLQKMGDIIYIANLIHWEMDTQMPTDSYEGAISIKTKVEMKIFEMSTSKEYKELLDDVISSSNFYTLSIEDRRYLLSLHDNFEKEQRIPTEFYEKYCTLRSNSAIAWKDAKQSNDYSLFQPYLEKIIMMTKELYSYKYPKEDLYDSMLNDYETGVTTKVIDSLFEKLKQELIPLVKKLHPITLPKQNQSYSDSELLDIATYLLDYIGFDNNRGTLGIYPHGYTMKVNNNDVRITFSKNKSIFDHVCTIIHEGGHGIFEQNVGSLLTKYSSYEIDKYALHESQSRFFENILGRNKNFWVPIYEEVKPQLKVSLSLDEFMGYLNNAKPSLIRTEADELTYCLHIIMRYEIERDLFHNKISVAELPMIWNRKMKEYLGVEVNRDCDGLLQDMHWSDGSFGYFPSYLLGSILDGMLLEAVEEQLGDINTILKEGRIKDITRFLSEKIHSYGGTYNIEEVAERVCHKKLEVQPLVKYFKQKYDN